MLESERKILLVDDDVRLSSLLQRYLNENGFAVSCVRDGAQMDDKLRRQHFDLLILDLMLPGEDGLTLCSRLRAAGQTLPVIMLTAKGDDIDRIIGLGIGADDYLPKPCNPRELVARIRTVLRRQSAPSAAAGVAPRLEFDAFTLDPAQRELRTPSQSVRLSQSEFALLHVLASHPHQPLSRERLMMLARGRDHDVFDRSIDMQISRLRKLLEDNPKQPRFIRTVWGLGYVFIPDP
ncbi:MAG: osmolarity response regulator transcription factor OmpR [Gammaproteobacteria bacterium]